MKATEERVKELDQKGNEALVRGDSLGAQRYIDEAESYREEANKLLDEITKTTIHYF